MVRKNSMMDTITGMIMFALIFGSIGWILHLIFILMSLGSKPKGTLEIDYNQYKELYPEIILIAGLVIFEIITLIIFMR